MLVSSDDPADLANLPICLAFCSKSLPAKAKSRKTRAGNDLLASNRSSFRFARVHPT